jgi:hypothetical protein
MVTIVKGAVKHLLYKVFVGLVVDSFSTFISGVNRQEVSMERRR